MTPKNWLRAIVFTAATGAALVVLTLSPLGPGAAPALAESHGGPDGKTIFLAQKCNLCHAVSSAGIEAKTASEKMKGPDLAGALADRDEGWLAKYLTKQESLDGEKHKKEFKGTDEELAALVDWLLEQKAED